MKLPVLNKAGIICSNTKIFAGCNSVVELAKKSDIPAKYVHPSTKQCNYTVESPTLTIYSNSAIGGSVGDTIQRLTDEPHDYIAKTILRYRDSYKEIPAVIITQPYDVFIYRMTIRHNSDGSASINQATLAHLKGCDVTLSAGAFGPNSATEVEICIGFDYSGSLSPIENDDDDEYNQIGIWGSHIYVIGYET